MSDNQKYICIDRCHSHNFGGNVSTVCGRTPHKAGLIGKCYTAYYAYCVRDPSNDPPICPECKRISDPFFGMMLLRGEAKWGVHWVSAWQEFLDNIHLT